MKIFVLSRQVEMFLAILFDLGQELPMDHIPYYMRF
jgi:hypothetical protein